MKMKSPTKFIMAALLSCLVIVWTAPSDARRGGHYRGGGRHFGKARFHRAGKHHLRRGGHHRIRRHHLKHGRHFGHRRHFGHGRHLGYNRHLRHGRHFGHKRHFGLGHHSHRSRIYLGYGYPVGLFLDYGYGHPGYSWYYGPYGYYWHYGYPYRPSYLCESYLTDPYLAYAKNCYDDADAAGAGHLTN